MPFVIRPPLHSAVADDPSLTLTLVDPDHNDRAMLRDLQRWDWRVTRLNFDDEEFIEALVEVERDMKKRRRQTHAMDEDLVGYTPRPTLEDIWHDEAETKLMEEAYAEEQEKRNLEQEERRLRIEEEDEGTWLKHIDRTHQTNGFLDYVDQEQESPGLVTRGLDHSCDISLREPARLHYFDDSHRYRTARIYSNAPHPRSRSLRSYFTRPIGFWNKSVDHNENTEDDRTIRVTTEIRMSPVADSPEPISRSASLDAPLPPLSTSPADEAFINLIFPGTNVSTRTYIRHTNTSAPPPPPPSNAPPAVVRADPYGWDAWDEQRQRKESAEASVKFFLGRERRSLDSRAREWEGIGRGADGKKRLQRKKFLVKEMEGEMRVSDNGELLDEYLERKGFGGVIGGPCML